MFPCFPFAFQGFVCLLSSMCIHSLWIDFKAIVWDAGGTEQSRLLKRAFATYKAEWRLFFYVSGLFQPGMTSCHYESVRTTKVQGSTGQGGLFF